MYPFLFTLNITFPSIYNITRNRIYKVITSCYCKKKYAFINLLIFYRGRKNDEEVVIEKCNEIIAVLPVSVSASFEKGKHLTFEEALDKLKERLGKSDAETK